MRSFGTDHFRRTLRTFKIAMQTTKMDGPKVSLGLGKCCLSGLSIARCQAQYSLLSHSNIPGTDKVVVKKTFIEAGSALGSDRAERLERQVVEDLTPKGLPPTYNSVTGRNSRSWVPHGCFK